MLLAFNALGKAEGIWAGDQLLQETRNSQTTTYVFEPQTFKPLAQIIDNQIYHYHLDHLGTPKHLTNHLRFQGQYFDEETGLHTIGTATITPAQGPFDRCYLNQAVIQNALQGLIYL